MGESLLYAAVGKNIPLIEVVIEFVEGIDYPAATAQLNALAEDFHLEARPYYDHPRRRVGSATKESLERLFSWRMKRFPLGRYEEEGKDCCPWPTYFRWAEVSPRERYPVEGIIHAIQTSQPGADDNGQWCE